MTSNAVNQKIFSRLVIMPPMLIETEILHFAQDDIPELSF